MVSHLHMYMETPTQFEGTDCFDIMMDLLDGIEELLEEEEMEEPELDYELIQIVDEIALTDHQAKGTRSASESAVNDLLELRVSKELLNSCDECSVCQEEFELKEDVKVMPCSHVYHPSCLLPWLELHNTCPSCRYELPTATDDTDYAYQDMWSSSLEDFWMQLGDIDAMDVDWGELDIFDF